MSRYGVTPNMLVIPPQLALYMAMAPEEKIKYMEGGNLAVSRFEEGTVGFETKSFRGLGVFTSVPFEVSDEGEALQLLQRHSQVGEFYRMLPPPVPPNKGQKLDPNYMDILIYDEEQDALKHISFSEAYWCAVGPMYQALKGGKPEDVEKIKKLLDVDDMKKKMERAYGEAEEAEYGAAEEAEAEEEADPGTGTGTDPGELRGRRPTPKSVSCASLDASSSASKRPSSTAAAPPTTKTRPSVGGPTVPAHTTSLKLLMKALRDFKDYKHADTCIFDWIHDCVVGGIWVPICVVVARPFIEHRMMSCVAAVSGRDTGATLFGPADMQISANTSVKTIEGHYTCHTKSIITKPQNVYCMRDIMCNGYVAGGNTTFFANPTSDTGYDLSDLSKMQQTVQDHVHKRLQMADPHQGDYASMFSFLCSHKVEVNMKRDQVTSLSERVLPWEVNAGNRQGVEMQKQYFPGGNAGWKVYGPKGLYPQQLDAIHYGEDVRASENNQYLSMGSTNNALCFLGPHRVYDMRSRNFIKLVPGQGHFGADAVPGDCRWRRGECVSMKAAREQLVSLEVASFAQLGASSVSIS